MQNHKPCTHACSTSSFKRQAVRRGLELQTSQADRADNVVSLYSKTGRMREHNQTDVARLSMCRGHAKQGSTNSL